MATSPRVGRYRFSLLFLIGLSIPVSIGAAIGRQWALVELQPKPPVVTFPPTPDRFELAAEFTIGGAQYQLLHTVESSFIPNEADMTVAVADEHGTILYKHIVPGHRFGLPIATVEIGENPILILDYHSFRPAELGPAGFSRVRYRITPTALEHICDEWIEPDSAVSDQDVAEQ
jgi:hypothetical protein